jgi:hypothetical protein
MKTVLYLDFIPDSLVLSQLKAQSLELIHFSDIEQEGHVWPNLVKRCTCVLVSGMTGLAEDDVKLSSLLQSMVGMGLSVQVLCSDQPLADIHRAMISGIQYHFGVDFDNPDQISEKLSEILNQESAEKFSA